MSHIESTIWDTAAEVATNFAQTDLIVALGQYVDGDVADAGAFLAMSALLGQWEGFVSYSEEEGEEVVTTDREDEILAMAAAKWARIDTALKAAGAKIQ